MGLSDRDVFEHAARDQRRVVTENVKDFRPLLALAYRDGSPLAPLLLVSARRYRRGDAGRDRAIAEALEAWLTEPGVVTRPDEDWLA